MEREEEKEKEKEEEEEKVMDEEVEKEVQEGMIMSLHPDMTVIEMEIEMETLIMRQMKEGTVEEEELTVATMPIPA